MVFLIHNLKRNYTNKNLIVNNILFPKKGIKNTGNICYANVGIQVLLHIKTFVINL